jgi:hypothetical protein
MYKKCNGTDFEKYQDKQTKKLTEYKGGPNYELNQMEPTANAVRFF